MTSKLFFLLAVSVITITYYFGRLLVAILFKTINDQLLIGFGPGLFSFKVASTKISVGWIIPLPFLLRIYAVKDDEKEPLSYPWQFDQVARWKRLIASFGGTYSLVIACILIFIGIEYTRVEAYIPKSTVDLHGIYAHELARNVGFSTGDRILSVNGKDYQRFSDLISPDVLLGEYPYYTVLRKEDTIRIDLPDDFLDSFVDSRREYISVNAPYLVGEVRQGSVADEIGLSKGDRILMVGEDTITSFPQFSELLDRYSSDTTSLLFDQDGRKISRTVSIPDNGKLGFYIEMQLEKAYHQKSLPEAMIAGYHMTAKVMTTNYRAFKRIFTGEVSSTPQIRGPVKIARIFGEFDLTRFFIITGTLMIYAAIFSLLPFPFAPALSLIPLLYELVLHKKISRKTFKIINILPIALLVSLMIIAIFKDIIALILN